MSKKLRVGIVANTTWNIYNFRRNVIRKLVQENIETYVLSPIDEYIKYKDEFPDVVHVPLKKLKRNSTNPIHDIQLTSELKSLYKKYNLDFIVHYTVKPNIYGGVAAHQLGIPSIGIVTGLGYAFIKGGMIETITKFLYRNSLKHHRKIIFENMDDRELFIQENLIESSQGVSIKGCGVDSEYFKPRKNGALTDKTIFTFIGRLLYDKGLMEFVNAAKSIKKKYKHAEFWIIGNLDPVNPASVPEAELQKWIDSGDITYKGFQSDVRSFIAESDCIVLPSYREAIARTITEGMSMERPVITTDTAGCREAVDAGVNGYLVPIKNVNALALAMEDFIHTDELARKAMGKSGREKVLNEFDDKLIADQIYDIIIGEIS